MSYLGNPLSTAFSSRIKQDFASPSGTSFTMNQAVSDPNDISLYINHVRQEPGIAYTVDGSSTLTTTGTLVSADDMYIIYDELTIQTAEHPEGQALRCSTLNASDTLSVSHGIGANSAATFTNTTANANVNGVVHVKQSNATNNPTMVIEQTGAGGNSSDIQGLHIKIGGQNSGNGHAIKVTTTNANLNSGNAYEAFSVTNGGNASLYGNLAFSQSGNGIDFNATTPDGTSVSSELLDDYEEGTFTPVANDFAGTMTFETARYIKIGKLVHVNFKMTSDGNGDADAISISGFPFSAVQEHPVSLSYDVAGNGAMQANTTPTIPNAMINTAETMYVYFPTGGAFQYTHMGTGFIRVSGTYITA